MKYLKKYKIFESKESKVLVNKLRNAFEGTEFDIDVYDNRSAFGDSDIVRIQDENGKYFYEFEEDDFDEETLRSAIQNENLSVLDRDIRREFERLHKVILKALDTPKDDPNEWWVKEIDNANLSIIRKQLAKIKENITKNPSWILRREEIEQFFQDAIDDVGDEYKYQLQILNNDGAAFTAYYDLEFDYILDLEKGNYTNSLSGFSNLLDTIHRAVKRLQAEDLNLKVYVVTQPAYLNMTTHVKIFSTRDILSGSIIDVEPEEEPTIEEHIEELRRRAGNI